ncbi:MAG: hypothetical protein F6K58_08345 [Symploca sp. SIO2E9]|nr:hypothetical protein [Symploca sp. SIO2E9]
MNRLVVAIGPWQIILAASAIRQETTELSLLPQDYLVLLGEGLSNQTKQTMMRIASLVWDWQSIIWIDDLFNSKLTEINRANFTKLLQAFRDKILIEQFEEIWLCRLDGKIPKLIVESYLEAAIVIYEEGLHQYAPGRGSQVMDDNWQSQLRRFKSELEGILCKQECGFYSFNNRGLLRNHISRLTKVYLFLTNTFTVPEYLKQTSVKQINKKSLLSTIELINNNAHLQKTLKINNQVNNKVLVLGQCFSKYNLMSWDEEFNIYSRVFSILAEQNFTPLWKEHPKIDRPFFNTLLEQATSVQPLELNIHFSWPVELFTKQLNIVGCVAGTSTSLFYQKELFNIPTYTFANELSFKNSSRDFLWMKNLVMRYVPPLASIQENK